MYLVNCFAIPLVPEQSTTIPVNIEPIDTEKPIKPIVFSHDSNPFDPKSYSFRVDANRDVSKPERSSAANPMVKLSRVLPIQNRTSTARQQRIHVFPPLFVYRQEQAMRRRATARPSIDPDRLYPYPPVPLDPYYYHHQPEQQQPYPNGYYTDYYYEPYPYPYNSGDYISNDLPHGAPEYWYPYH